ADAARPRRPAPLRAPRWCPRGAGPSRDRAVEAEVRRTEPATCPEARCEQVHAPEVGRHRAEAMLVRPPEDVRRERESGAGAPYGGVGGRVREVDVPLG